MSRYDQAPKTNQSSEAPSFFLCAKGWLRGLSFNDLEKVSYPSLSVRFWVDLSLMFGLVELYVECRGRLLMTLKRTSPAQ
jgi:hypothetical protein